MDPSRNQTPLPSSPRPNRGTVLITKSILDFHSVFWDNNTVAQIKENLMTGMILALAMFLQQTTAPVPKVSGPIEGPGVMYPGLRDLPKGTELADLNYVAKEYFVSGTANGKPYTT